MEKSRRSSGKCPKLSDGEENMASIDRLSSLPDVVICHILSFLPTKRSVATSILGKRWRFLWAHVPCLHFSGDNVRQKGIRASDTINRVIFRHKAKRLDTLTLCDLNCNEYQLETWITTAIDRSIRNLYLKLKFETFPRSLFNCKTIVKLKLENYSASLSAVKNVSLPSLKKLYVHNLVCENDDALPCFLSGCPSLRILNMIFLANYDYVGCINISSPTIMMLQIAFKNSLHFDYRMIINSPALRYLQVNDYDLECITIPITMISLVKADIRLKSYRALHLKANYNSMVVKFLHSLCYVKCLKISGQVFDKFVHGEVACSTVKFDNLTKLEVLLDFKWSLLVKFLGDADNLQVLICDQVYYGEGHLCAAPEQVPKCMLSCLRTIKIKSMRFNEHEFDMVRYLLRNSRALERMELFYECIDLEKNFQALKRISLFERGSDACQLDFLPDCW